MLAPGPGARKPRNFQILFMDNDLFLGIVGHDRNRHCGRVRAASTLCRRHSLNAVPACFLVPLRQVFPFELQDGDSWRFVLKGYQSANARGELVVGLGKV